MVGSPVVIMPHFEPEAFCRNIEKYKVTVSFTVPPICLTIVHHPGTIWKLKVNNVGFS